MVPSFNPLPYSHLGLVSISKYISTPRLPLPSTTFRAGEATSAPSAIGPCSVVSHRLALFVSLVHLRGRTRGRAVVDEEDSMDGTEIAESMGPQDTGKAVDLPLGHRRRVRCVCSDVRLERAHRGALMQSASKGDFSKGSLSLLQKDGPEPFLAPVASTSELIERVYLEL